MSVQHGGYTHAEGAGHIDPACPNCDAEQAKKRDREMISALLRSLEEIADWGPGSTQAREYEWPDRLGWCWCGGSKRHSAACRRARTIQQQARALIGPRSRS